MTPPTTPLSLESLLAERSWLRALSVSLVGASDADDLAQDAVLVALERRGSAGASDDPVLSMKGWLAGITYRLAMARRRREAGARGHEHMYGVDARVEGRLDARPAVDELAERAELEGEVVAELLRLPEPQRGVMLLRFQGGLSGAQIARQLDRPDGTVRRQLKTGLDQLRQRMDDRRGGRAAWAPLLIALPATRVAAVGAASAATGAAALIPFLALSMKKLLIALAVLLAATAWWTRALWLEQPGGAGAAAPLVLVGEAPPAVEGLDTVPGAVPDARRSAGLAVAAPVEETASAPATVRYRILNARGEAVQVEHAVLSWDEVAIELDVADGGLLAIAADCPDLPEALERSVASLAVSRTNAWPEVFGVRVAPGVQDVTWPSGRDVEGQLLDAGREPGEAITMKLVRDIGWSGSEELERLEQTGGAFPVRVRADATGRFTLHDLPDGWRGWLRHGRAWRFAPASEISDIFEVEDAQLRLAVVRTPRIIGRLVSADGGGRTADAMLGVWEVKASGSRSWFTAVTDADGRFEWFPRPSTASVTVQVGADERFRSKDLVDLAIPAGGLLDLGDVAVESAGRLTVHVMDPAGLPVASALVRESGSGAVRAWATGDDGLATLRINGMGQIELQVSAEGFAKGRFEVSSESGADALELRLEPSLHVDLTVRGQDGSLSAGTEVTFAPIEGGAGDYLFGGDWQAAVKRGQQTSQGERVDGRRRYTVVSDEEGRIELRGLPRSVQFRCGFQDRDWDWIAPPLTISADANGEWRGELVEMRASAPVIHGRVTTLDGEPIEGASVRLRLSGTFTTDASGSFEVPCEPGTEKVLLSVSAPAFAVEHIWLEGPEELGSPVEIQLQKERALSVRVVDAQGQPVRDARLVVWRFIPPTAGPQVHSKDGLPEGPYRVPGAPAGELELEIVRDGVPYKRRVGAEESAVEVVLEAPGELTVDWSAIEAVPAGVGLRLPNASGDFGEGRPRPAEMAGSWTLRQEDKDKKRRTVGVVPGRYQVMLVSRKGILGTAEVEVRAGASLTIVMTP
ncbi:MAG: RNA polymerase sigma-70 factor (ECF subfamily) [Planctomycetota bacterium]|jgi:RNA polymerase sigma-70 factor (ECF subfamily)